MRGNLNFWSFGCSLVAIVFFLVLLFFEQVMDRVFLLTGINPFGIMLGISAVTLFLGLLGLKDVNGWKTMTRSLVAICLACGILAAASYLLIAEFFANGLY